MRWTLLPLSLLAIAARCEDSNFPRSISSGYKNVAYFGNWNSGNFTPQDLPITNLTHVLYAFADVNPDTGEVFLNNPLVDTGNLPEWWSGSNLSGFLQQFYLLKKQNRKLKVLLSIGGASYSSNFALPSSPSAALWISTFASSVVSLVNSTGLDGVDIDWQYPANASQAGNFVLLLQEVRDALDVYTSLIGSGYHFLLTVAGPGPFGYQQLLLPEMDQCVDFWNLMAYDYTGSWSNLTGDQANLFRSSNNSESTPFNTEDIISYYTSQGISRAKIVLGMPLYGRSFNNTDGLGERFSNGSTYSLKDLPLSGAVEYYDNSTVASYSYSPEDRQLVSYDTITVANNKASFIQNNGLAGAMFWESSQDGVGPYSLIQSVAQVLGGSDGLGLDNATNQLSYPNSTFVNVRDGMPDSSTTPSTPTTSAAPSLAGIQSSLLLPSTTLAVFETTAPTCNGGVCGTYEYKACPVINWDTVPFL